MNKVVRRVRRRSVTSVHPSHHPILTPDIPRVQALARACLPDALEEEIPPATGEAAAALVARMAPLLDILADAEPTGSIDSAALRLAAACALLRCARRHDAALDAETYQALALVMQVRPPCTSKPF